MQLIGFALGLVSIVGWTISLIPLLGWLNWIFIPIAILGLIFSLMGISGNVAAKGFGVAGIVMCLIVIVFGALRLKIGCGIF